MFYIPHGKIICSLVFRRYLFNCTKEKRGSGIGNFYMLIGINPLLPIAHKKARIDKISILKLEGIIKKISYERRDYESVDEKSLSKAMSRKTMKKKKNSGTKGSK